MNLRQIKYRKVSIYAIITNLTFRTAIEAVHTVRQSRTSGPILFAVCIIKKQALTGGKIFACEDKCSKKEVNKCNSCNELYVSGDKNPYNHFWTERWAKKYNKEKDEKKKIIEIRRDI